jgi:SAM-dependent methyltransferase
MLTSNGISTTAGATPCGVCGAATRGDVTRPASTYAQRGRYSIARCDRCGTGRTVPVPTPNELEAFYGNHYGYDAHSLIEAEKRWRARRVLDVSLSSCVRRLLDVGCMYGYLLEEAKRRGVRDVMGVELSSALAEAAAAKGLQVFKGDIEAFAVRGHGTFDLIVAQHVLEHVGDPVRFLEHARRLLSPGGTLCICVPNDDARGRRLFRESWGWYQVPVHLHHFGVRGLEQALDAAGFTVERAERRGGDSLFVIATLLQSVGTLKNGAYAGAPSALARTIARVASTVLRPYYFVGDDELLVLASPR